MTNLLLRLFVRGYQDPKQPRVRSAVGKLSGIVGILCNVVLFAFKLAVGAISGSVEEAAATASEEADAAAAAIVCERCGTSLSQFTKSGKLGCPNCYQAFREQLTPMLQQIHGRVQHAGRKPLDDEAAQRRRAVYERLSRQLEQAVAMEDFETAAILRDQLRQLRNAEGGEDDA